MEQAFAEFLGKISGPLQDLLVAIFTILAGQAVFYLKTQYSIAKTKLSAEQRFYLDIVSQRAVQTVEQLYYSQSNEDKKAKAIAIIESELAKAKLTVDFDVIVNAIEAQVFKKNQALPQG